MGKTQREDRITRLIIEGEDPCRRPRKPRHLGSGYHTDKRERRNNTRSSQLQSEIEDSEQEQQEQQKNKQTETQTEIENGEYYE